MWKVVVFHLDLVEWCHQKNQSFTTLFSLNFHMFGSHLEAEVVLGPRLTLTEDPQRTHIWTRTQAVIHQESSTG